MNKRGFTLVELLATITILGILSGIGVVAVSAILNNARKNYYSSLKGTIESAARSYYSDHRALLPVGEGESTKVNITTLETNRYLSPVKDNGGSRSCSGSVTVTRQSVENYQYKVSLTCAGTNY